MTKLQVVVGGQFGSEGKGAVAAYLSSKHAGGLTVRVAGPNAGHTVIGRCPPDCSARAFDKQGYEDASQVPGFHRPDAHPWRLRQVPVTAVSNPASMLAIAAGSEVDPLVLEDELNLLDAAGYRASDRLSVDYQATIITEGHRDVEYAMGLTDRIGSTGKGIGAARSDRLMRLAPIAIDYYKSRPTGPRLCRSVADILIRQHLLSRAEVLIEGTQGYGLGLHAGHYPHCTSSDCTATDMLAMAGVAPWEVRQEDLEIWVVFRTFPIRVAGKSGPLRGETTWGDLGLAEEQTTVTRKTRRVGHWDGFLARRAMEANGFAHGAPWSPVHAALTMADYVMPQLSGITDLIQLPEEFHDPFDVMLGRYSHDIGKQARLVGTGPATMLDFTK